MWFATLLVNVGGPNRVQLLVARQFALSALKNPLVRKVHHHNLGGRMDLAAVGQVPAYSRAFAVRERDMNVRAGVAYSPCGGDNLKWSFEFSRFVLIGKSDLCIS